MAYKACDFRHIYWIGGSPCSGKSTIAGQIANQYTYTYYKCDDHFGDHMQRAMPKHHPVLTRLPTMSWEAIWMREIDDLLTDEIHAYEEEFPMILDDLRQFPSDKPIIAEGASLMPELVWPLLSDIHHAIWIVPTPDFQRQYYSQRDWIQGILKETSDPEQAFDNWMRRDARFASHTLSAAAACGYKTIVVDGTQSIDENRRIVEQHFFARSQC